MYFHFQATGRVRVIRLIITHTGFHPAPECRETRLSSHVSVLLPRHPLPGLVEDALDRRRDERLKGSSTSCASLAEVSAYCIPSSCVLERRR